MGRLLGIGGLVAVLLGAVLVVTTLAGRGTEPVPAGAAAPAAPGPLVVFTAWQQRRSAAWESGDVTALRELYADRATAQDDVRMLRTYLRRGLTVVGMRNQVLSYRVLEARTDLLRLAVTERLAGGEIRGPGEQRTPLPRDQPDVREVTLVREGEGWLMAAVG